MGIEVLKFFFIYVPVAAVLTFLCMLSIICTLQIYVKKTGRAAKSKGTLDADFDDIGDTNRHSLTADKYKTEKKEAPIDRIN